MRRTPLTLGVCNSPPVKRGPDYIEREAPSGVMEYAFWLTGGEERDGSFAEACEEIFQTAASWSSLWRKRSVFFVCWTLWVENDTQLIAQKF